MSNIQLVTFLDTLGRTIIGEDVTNPNKAEFVLSVKNPAIVHITPEPTTGQIRLQILPLFFKEFLADKDSATVWNYLRSNITVSDPITLDFKVAAQYGQIFTPVPAPVQSNEAPTIKLFDDETK